MTAFTRYLDDHALVSRYLATAPESAERASLIAAHHEAADALTTTFGNLQDIPQRLAAMQAECATADLDRLIQLRSESSQLEFDQSVLLARVPVHAGAHADAALQLGSFLLSETTEAEWEATHKLRGFYLKNQDVDAQRIEELRSKEWLASTAQQGIQFELELIFGSLGFKDRSPALGARDRYVHQMTDLASTLARPARPRLVA